MLCSLILAATLAQAEFVVTTLKTDGEPRLFASLKRDSLQPPFVDPMHGWEFPFYVEGVAGSRGSAVSPRTRFKVYAQSAHSRKLAVSATRTLLRLWDESVNRLNIDHPAKYAVLVHVLICDGGKAGGEQSFVRSRSPRDNFASYNAIYIYHAEGLTNPVEATRELAHEYGHAVLPAVGGFKQPEEWANGALGEQLFMRYLVRAYDKIQPDDVHGATEAQLRQWLSMNAEPLAASIARRRIDQTALAGVGRTAMNEYLGLMLLIDDLFPDLVGRALKLAGGQTAIDALKGAIEAVNEQKGWVIEVPAHYGSEIWLPIAGKCSWTGAKPIQTLGAWTKVRLSSRKISARRIS
jgi:hypothetical protein